MHEALERVTRFLADKSVPARYCSSARLYGYPEKYYWDFHFFTEDGGGVAVRLTSAGDITVQQGKGERDRPGPPDSPRKNMAEIKKLIEAAIAEHKVATTIEQDKGRLTVCFKPREFSVYPRKETGGFADKWESVVGPDMGGFWLHLREMDDVAPRTSHSFPWWADSCYPPLYWSSARETVYLTEPNKYAAVEWRADPQLTPYSVARAAALRHPFAPSTIGRRRLRADDVPPLLGHGRTCGYRGSGMCLIIGRYCIYSSYSLLCALRAGQRREQDGGSWAR
jgi:hypothetical protein